MIWLTWRQHRIEAIIALVMFLLIALVLVITGLNLASAFHTLVPAACIGARISDACDNAKYSFMSYFLMQAFGNQQFNNICMILVYALPAIPGIFVGSTVVAREIEQGTYRMAWTQGITWARWLAFKIGLLAGTVLILFILLQLLLAWWFQPLLATTYNVWMYFDVTGIVPIAYSLFAFALGLAFGTFLRRTVPAMALTLFVFLVLRIAITLVWRPYFLPPLNYTYLDSADIARTAQALIARADIVDRQGNAVPTVGSSEPQVCVDDTREQQSHDMDINACMKKHGLQYRLLYQPQERLWLFQAIEAGVFLVLAICMSGCTFWWIKRRIM